MSTIAEIRFPAEEFALAETLATVPDVEFETVRVVAHETDRVLPLVWAQTDETFESLEGALADDPSVENLSRLATLPEERLYRMDWVADIKTIIHILLERDGIVLSASGWSESWHLRILFPDRDSLSGARDFAADNGLTFDLRKVTDLNEGRGSQFALTEAQHQTLVTAYDRGYYEIPQDVTLNELAEEFGVSPQAVSQRLHRSYRNLIENALVIGHPTDSFAER